MLAQTDTPDSPWFVVEADDKRKARLNMIHHLLSSIDFYAATRPPLEIPHRPQSAGYERPPKELSHYVPDFADELLRR
jgi:hypothetical protein